ncbi:phosphorylase [Spirulina major CS-329]|uniref:ATP adenylyltransferase family protein n=1 Tax=Spirulina TaxID=1154 RepID=UPI002330C9BB|nr:MULTISPECIES: phosphorylase [Spirulina]MDB9496198.1 phosphorylase [Spirulina subsalsa CS-330]MDB9502841.1 phosphorylase [Spirulina major CS-329]
MSGLNLWQSLVSCSTNALKSGALQPISTHHEFLTEAGLTFLVHVSDNLQRKTALDTLLRSRAPDFNPFLPYEEALFVADLSPTHLCLLNKFNVVEHHSLIVTRAFEAQETWLTVADFAAIAHALSAIEGLAFYNGGRDAGASQRHKHLQLVPYPLLPPGYDLPLEVAITAMPDPHAPNPIPAFRFRHAFAPLTPTMTPADLHRCYGELLSTAGLHYQGEQQTAPYNLLMTRAWMVIVPRSRDRYQGISVNSLGFAGTLFVATPEQRATLTTLGPLSLLEQVAIPLP